MAKFYGKAAHAANAILDAFREPNRLPAALAPAFIRRRDNVPCRAWSWSNQLLVAIHGHSDARGYRQWQDVGRHVRKGQRSFCILVPLTKRVERENESGETTDGVSVYGFKAAPVFGLAQTDGEPLSTGDPSLDAWVESLPVLDVARSWGLTVETYSGEENAPLGFHRRGSGIALGVRNLSTWSHEMLHAADDRLGTLTEKPQHWRSEVVAELGGAILLRVLGHDHEADLGGCWEYVSAYATDAKVEPLVACQRVLKRTCDAVALVLETAELLTATA